MKITIDIDEKKKAIIGYVIPQEMNPLDAIQIFNSVSNSIISGLKELQKKFSEEKNKILKPSLKDIKAHG